MEFGLFHGFQIPGHQRTKPCAVLCAGRRRRAVGARCHVARGTAFRAHRSVLASPLILAAAIAQRTRRMKIGTAVQVLPLCHPLRLAEEAATVDQISDGRLIFGVGRSGFAPPMRPTASPMKKVVSASPSRWRLSNGPGPRSASRTGENISPTTRWHRSRSLARSRIRRSASPPPASIPMPRSE